MTRRKKQRRRIPAQIHEASIVACRAELIYIEGELVIVEECRDEGVNGRKHRVEGKWIADWAGCEGVKGFGVNGQTREEVISRMTSKIKTQKQIRDVRVWVYQRKLREEIKNMASNNAPEHLSNETHRHRNQSE